MSNPAFFKLCDTWHLIPHSLKLTLRLSSLTYPTENLFSYRVKLIVDMLIDQRWVWFKWVITFKERLRVNPRWAHLYFHYPQRHRKSGEWTERALPRDTGSLGNGVTRAGVSAALIENGYRSSYSYIISLWCSFRVSLSCFLWCQNLVTDCWTVQTTESKSVCLHAIQMIKIYIQESKLETNLYRHI